MSGLPSNIIVPMFAFDFAGSKAGGESAEFPVKLFVLGQRLSTGLVPAETPHICYSASDAEAAFGHGSMLHRMSIYIFKNLSSVPCVFIALDDEETGVAGTKTITVNFTGIAHEATGNGSLYAYIGGQRVVIPVSVGDIADNIAISLGAAITDQKNALSFTVTTVTANVITLTARHKGLSASDLDIRFNYNEGEIYPGGVTCVVADGVTGTVDPDVGDALEVIVDDWPIVMANPYNDSSSMAKIEEYYLLQSDILTRKEGICYQAMRGSDTAALIAFATNSSRNSTYMVLENANNRLQSTYEFAAASAAGKAQSIISDPAMPLKSIQLIGINALERQHRLKISERNTLAKSGIATCTDHAGVMSEATVTMYLKNAVGAADTTYQQQNKLFILLAARNRLENRFATRYPRAKLTDSIEGLRQGQQVMTSDIGRSEALAWFNTCVYDGWFEGGQANFDQFNSQLIVSRDSVNTNRLNFLLPPNLIDQFLLCTGTIQFI